MTQISTLSEFLLQAGTEYRIYDIGRGITPLPEQVFLDIENGQQPYPYPRQGYAWIGIIFWNKHLSDTHYIWFLKFNLDETCCLMTGPRDHFLELVVNALEKETSNTSDTLAQVENPYSFTPNQQTLANFNALTKKALGISPSRHYEEVLQFLKAPSVMNWQQLATQGIADFCARLNEPHNSALLVKVYSALASPVRKTLLSSMENYELNEELAKTLIDFANAHHTDIDLIALTLRALAKSLYHPFVQHYILNIIASDEAQDINILSVVVARHWPLLVDEQVATQLLEQAATLSFDLCSGLYIDLVMIPLMRRTMLGILGKPVANPTLAACIEQLKKELIK